MQAAEIPGKKPEKHLSRANVPANLVDFLPGFISRFAARKRFPEIATALLLTMAASAGYAQPVQACTNVARLHSDHFSR